METDKALAPFVFGDPCVGYDTNQEHHIGPGEPNPDSPGASYTDCDDAPHPNLAGDGSDEDESDDGDYMPRNTGRAVPVPNTQPDNHTLHHGPPHVRREKPCCNLRPKGPHGTNSLSLG